MSTSAADLSALFDAIDETGTELVPTYNVAPTNVVPIVRSSADERVMSLARWGLVPSWAPDRSRAAKMINSRSETVASSRAFASSFTKRRCLVPVDGWYEWMRRAAGRKQPYFMTRHDGAAIGLAGIWSMWGSGDEAVMTFSVLTTAAVGDMRAVHDRMPLVLPERRWDGWLAHDRAPDPDELLVPPTEALVSEFELRPVGARVGDVRNDDSELIQRVAAAPFGQPSEPPGELSLF